jgi:hypothetical protein
MGTDLLSEIRREIEERLVQLRPAVAEYEQLLEAAAAVERRDGSVAPDDDAPAARAAAPASRARAGGGPRGASRDGVVGEAILAALEHGSHTPAELAVVTGKGAVLVNRELRRLVALELVARTKREGKQAWSLRARG